MSFTTTSPSAAGMATVKYHDGEKSAPILNDGIITPSILQIWRKKAELFFEVKAIDPKDRVKSILSSFCSPSLVNWVNENEPTLRTLSWANFFSELKKTTLTPGWDFTIFRSMVNIKQPSSQSFAKWMNDIWGANFSLTDTRFHKNAATLRAHLESHISDDLAKFLASLSKNERDRIDTLENLEEWLCEMINLDEKMTSSRKRHLALVDEAVKCQHTSFTAYRSTASRPTPPSNPSNYPTPQSSSIPPQSSSIVPKLSTLLRAKVPIPPGYRFPPKLTDSERELLRANHGCRICRQLFVDHTGNCNRLPPDASIYRPITAELIAEAKRTGPIAALATHASIQSLDEGPSTSLPVAAVIPSETASFTLGDGSFSTDEVGPLCSTHLIWPAMAMAPDGTSVSTTCLIDTGTHLTCIRTDVARKLNLSQKKLAKPLSVTLAFQNSTAK